MSRDEKIVNFLTSAEQIEKRLLPGFGKTDYGGIKDNLDGIGLTL